MGRREVLNYNNQGKIGGIVKLKFRGFVRTG